MILQITDNSLYLILGGAGLLILLLAIIFKDKVFSKISKDGWEIKTENNLPKPVSKISIKKSNKNTLEVSRDGEVELEEADENNLKYTQNDRIELDKSKDNDVKQNKK